MNKIQQIYEEARKYKVLDNNASVNYQIGK